MSGRRDAGKGSVVLKGACDKMVLYDLGPKCVFAIEEPFRVETYGSLAAIGI